LCDWLIKQFAFWHIFFQNRGMPDRPPVISFADMRSAGIGVLFLLLSACASVDSPPSTYMPPSEPTRDAVIAGLKTVALETKVTAPLEVSAVRPSDHGPGRYFVCLRATLPAPASAGAPTDITAGEPSSPSQPPPSPSPVPRLVYLSVFFDSDVYKGARQAVIIDACEIQPFLPVDLSPPPPPASPPAKRNH
jgi:hypothetical protein